MPTATEFKPRYTGTIEFADDVPFPNIERGVVLVNGGSPNARVTIMEFDDSRHGRQVDIMQKVTVSEEKGKIILQGQSFRVIHELKDTVDPVTTVTVKLNGKCADCGYA